jgi:hypothetical protein
MNTSRKIGLGAALVAAAAAASMGIASAVSSSSPASSYNAVAPTRLLDTRVPTGVTTKAPITSGGVVKLQIEGVGGVPASGVTAVTLNVTVTGTKGAGFISVSPDGVTPSSASSLNYTANETVANLVTVPVGSDGKVDLYVHNNTTDLVADLEGYYTAAVAGAQGPAGPAGAQGPAGPAGPAGASYVPVTATATTALSDRSDSGNHGNWATDTISRTVAVARHSAVPAKDCGSSATQCWFYTGTIEDTGTFTTIAGADSPQAGVAITGTQTGSMIGGSEIEFYASSDTPNASLVPATATGNTVSTTTWAEQLFADGTLFSTPKLTNWSWTYTDTSPANCETWTDAYNNSDGSLVADGDITGSTHCS